MIKFKGITITKRLEDFLRKERVYTRFCNNINNPKEWAVDYCGELDSIAHCFQWSKTPEGLDFWNELNDKFHNNK